MGIRETRLTKTKEIKEEQQERGRSRKQKLTITSELTEKIKHIIPKLNLSSITEEKN